jgi:hypothetical protein
LSPFIESDFIESFIGSVDFESEDFVSEGFDPGVVVVGAPGGVVVCANTVAAAKTPAAVNASAVLHLVMSIPPGLRIPFDDEQPMCQ